jgi:hypothetical protein
MASLNNYAPTGSSTTNKIKSNIADMVVDV